MQIMKLDSRAMFLEWGDFAPGDIWQYLKTLSVITTSDSVLLVSSGKGEGG